MTSPAAAFEALRRGFDGVQGPPPGTFTIGPVDRLGPATPETRAEVKSARRAEQRKALKEWATFWIALLVGAVLISVGSVIGNQRNVDVTDLWKFVPSLSGERAEPEGGQ